MACWRRQSIRWITRLRAAVAVWTLLGLSACVDAQPVPVAPMGQSAPSAAPPGDAGSTAQQESVPAAVAATDQPSQDNLVAYLNTVRDRVKSHLRYPELLRRDHVTGTVEFGVTILRNGRVISIELQRSSGITEIDLVAEKAIRDSSPLPPPPTDLAGDKVTLHALMEIKPD